LNRSALAFGGGAVIGNGAFRFAALEAVILSKAMSLIVVATAVIFRTRTGPLDVVAANGPIILSLRAGSLVGAWLGAGWQPAKNRHRSIG
jgi:uncharacterized membrane protein YfcA